MGALQRYLTCGGSLRRILIYMHGVFTLRFSLVRSHYDKNILYRKIYFFSHIFKLSRNLFFLFENFNVLKVLCLSPGCEINVPSDNLAGVWDLERLASKFGSREQFVSDADSLQRISAGLTHVSINKRSTTHWQHVYI